MDVLAQTPQTESKDIKLSKGKNTDSKSEEGKDFFENIISEIISESEEGEHKSFLLSKLLNLSSDFEKKEHTLSEFSDAPLFNDHQIGQVSIQDLLKIAMKLKNSEEPGTFPTDSKTLKLALLKPEVVDQFKNAKNIKELLDVAKKNNIEVKNFQFFNESAALDPKDKKMVQKINSEDIFKLIEKQIDTKSKLNLTNLNNSKEVTKNDNIKTTILQTVLASKEIIKPQHNKVKNEKEQLSVTNIKAQTKTVASEVKETNTNIKTVIPEVKETKVSKIVTEVEKSKEPQNVEPNKETETKKTVELKASETIKQKEFKSNIQSTINVNKINDNKEIQTAPVKTELVSEKVESETQSTEKTTISSEPKTQNIDKTKNTPDIKRTFSTFAEEFKEKVENYKPPLMKIKMELKPAGLGDVDVTLLSRGNNLQVNINSNTNTIAMFMQNQNEFKNSLVNMGFSDLQMNFSEQQKKEQDAQNQKNGKNIFEQLEENEEQDGFEMIIPRYV